MRKNVKSAATKLQIIPQTYGIKSGACGDIKQIHKLSHLLQLTNNSLKHHLRIQRESEGGFITEDAGIDCTARAVMGSCWFFACY